jgi:hypothetical protein
MKKTLMFMVTAATVAGSAFAGSAVAQDRMERNGLTAHQIAAETDIRHRAYESRTAADCGSREGLGRV